MWKGILSVYKMLVKNLDPKMAKIDIINTTTTLDSLTHLYFFPPFKEQLYGREEIFLEANLEALKRFKSFIENYHPTGSMMKIPFYREPFSVARVALMLQQRTNPQNYYAIIPDLAGVRFSSEQKTTDIKKYLDLVIPALEKRSQGGKSVKIDNEALSGDVQLTTTSGASPILRDPLNDPVNERPTITQTNPWRKIHVKSSFAV